MIKAMFVTPNKSYEIVYGTTRVLGGRAIRYGKKNSGDVFNVAVADVRSRPDRYLAPCGEPFTFDAKGGIISPCPDEPVAPEVEHGANLTDIPGVGPAISKTFAESGIYTQKQVAELTEQELIDLRVPPMSRRKIQEWAQSS